MSTPSGTATTIVVVDSRPVDYGIARSWAMTNGVEFKFLLCGGDALRMAAAVNGSLWMVNVELPDMTGFDLLEMLRETLDSPFVVMVADRYHPPHEIRSAELNAPCYVCKPLEAGWFDQLLHGLSDRATREPQSLPAETIAPSLRHGAKTFAMIAGKALPDH